MFVVMRDRHILVATPSITVANDVARVAFTDYCKPKNIPTESGGVNMPYLGLSKPTNQAAAHWIFHPDRTGNNYWHLFMGNFQQYFSDLRLRIYWAPLVDSKTFTFAVIAEAADHSIDACRYCKNDNYVHSVLKLDIFIGELDEKFVLNELKASVLYLHCPIFRMAARKLLQDFKVVNELS